MWLLRVENCEVGDGAQQAKSAHSQPLLLLRDDDGVGSSIMTMLPRYRTTRPVAGKEKEKGCVGRARGVVAQLLGPSMFLLLPAAETCNVVKPLKVSLTCGCRTSGRISAP